MRKGVKQLEYDPLFISRPPKGERGIYFSNDQTLRSTRNGLIRGPVKGALLTAGEGDLSDPRVSRQQCPGQATLEQDFWV
jgi:hypothetical protein